MIKQQMLSWANRFGICCLLNNNEYASPYSSFEYIVGAGGFKVFQPEHDDFFSLLSSFISYNHDWIFGHFNYDLKNIIEPGLVSENPDSTAFPDCFLFVPEVVLLLNGAQLTIGVLNGNAEEFFKEIVKEPSIELTSKALKISARISKQDYLNTIIKLQQHIYYGDCYEINYCQEFYGTGEPDPLSTYQQLNRFSPNPFSAYYKIIDKYLLCASPERFIKKINDTLVSQPIKGTAARDMLNAKQDEENRKQLYESPKERSENIMIVDLVRNDLSKVCKEGTVMVHELCGIYSFPTVHQMISTVKGKVDTDKSFADILKATFPMGSMTGAPKKRVMEIIEQYEQSKRGIYSGTVGYITPEKNFDFNVVIRSLVYNEASHCLSFHVGSAITAYSNAEKEYEECLLKGKSLMRLFE